MYVINEHFCKVLNVCSGLQGEKMIFAEMIHVKLILIKNYLEIK
jgi:hypothetical protein